WMVRRRHCFGKSPPILANRFVICARSAARWRTYSSKPSRAKPSLSRSSQMSGSAPRDHDMPIFDQGYQHWQGKLSGHAWGWLSITRQGVRTQLRSRWVRGLILISWVPALLLAFFMVCWGLAEQKAYAGVRDLLVNMFELPRDIVTSPKSYRSPVWTIAYEIYFQVQVWFCLGVVMIIGPGLISQDLRFNAMPLYFSKPLRRL